MKCNIIFDPEFHCLCSSESLYREHCTIVRYLCNCSYNLELFQSCSLGSNIKNKMPYVSKIHLDMYLFLFHVVQQKTVMHYIRNTQYNPFLLLHACEYETAGYILNSLLCTYILRKGIWKVSKSIVIYSLIGKNSTTGCPTQGPRQQGRKGCGRAPTF